MDFIVRSADKSIFVLLVHLLFSASAYAQDTPYLDAYLSAYSVAPGDSIDLYTSTSALHDVGRSVSPGDSIDLYTSTSEAIYSVEIYQSFNKTRVTWAEYEELTGISQLVPEQAWANCCEWESPLSIEIPEYWNSGIYQVAVRTSTPDGSGLIAYLQITVRAKDPGSNSKILVLDNAPNDIAYNPWGGGSAYWSESPEREHEQILSLYRPGSQNFLKWTEYDFVQWAIAMGIKLEFASLMDLHYDPGFLDSYETVIIVGHSEYWSRSQRDALDSFLASGGNLMILGGNTMWWQVRYSGNQMIIYKDVEDDPLTGIDNDLVTGRWYEWPVSDPENRTIGLSFRNGGMVNNGTWFTGSRGFGGYTITDSGHQYLAGTGLGNGDVLGAADLIVGNEVDGALFNWIGGKPVVTGEDGTPGNFEIMGISPAGGNDRNCILCFGTMGVFEHAGGGEVFNAATIRWSGGLWSRLTKSLADPQVSKITLNVLASWQPESAANCTNSTSVIDFDGDGITDACDSCVAIANPGQLDSDQDNTGDLCESAPLQDTEHPDIDVDPASTANWIDQTSVDNVTVAVMGSSKSSGDPTNFFVRRIDPTTVRFGNAAPVSPTPLITDIDGDSNDDLSLQFRIRDIGISCEDFQASLTGSTQNKGTFQGTEAIRTPPCPSCHP